MQQVEAGALSSEVGPAHLPTLLEQFDLMESTSGGASERFGSDLPYIKTVITKVLWRGDMCSRQYAPVNDEQGGGHNISHLLHW